VVGKNFAKELHHCHNWQVALRMLESCEDDRQRALTFGFLTHLSADIVAPNFFVPYKSVEAFRARTAKHSYWELRWDREVLARPGVWDTFRRITRRKFPEHDAFLGEQLGSGSRLFSFGTSRKIFSSYLLLTRLERKSNAYEGLNLTYQTLDGVLKYKRPVDSRAGHGEGLAKGFYGWDREWIEEIVTRTGSGWERSFECQIMDVADDIAYSVHDLEDGLKAGFIRAEDFEKFPPGRIRRAVNAALAAAGAGRELDEDEIHGQLAAIARRTDRFEREAGRAARKMLTRSLIHELATAVDVDRGGRVVVEAEGRVRMEILKAFLSYTVIFNPRVTTLGHKGREILRTLFGTLDGGPDSLGLFPEDHGEAYERALVRGSESDRKRVVCDFLAGMTDAYAIRFYSRLFVPGEGSFYELL